MLCENTLRCLLLFGVDMCSHWKWAISPWEGKLPALWENIFASGSCGFFLYSLCSRMGWAASVRVCLSVCVCVCVCVYRVYLVGSKRVAVSWHRATSDGNRVPNSTLQVVAAEQSTRTSYFNYFPNKHHVIAHKRKDTEHTLNHTFGLSLCDFT